MIGGGVPNFGLASGILLVPQLERYTGFAHADYDLSNLFKPFIELSYGYNNSLAYNIQPRTSTVMQVSNPFLPAAVRAGAVAAGVTSFTLGRISDDIGHIMTTVSNRNYRAATGFKGDLGSGWTWDGYYQYGRNDYRQTQAHQLINANFALAADAVTGANGQITCRSTLTNPANGCVPINLFGQGSPSQAAINYVTGSAVNRTIYTQQVAALNVHGEPFSTWAGRVSIAAGFEHRHKHQLSTVDSLSLANAFNVQNPKPLDGSFTVNEGYLEAVLPVLRDAPLAQSIDLNGAVRYADYTTIGGVVTWKGGVTWNANDWLLLRGTRSRDIRAPNLFELHSTAAPITNVVADPFTNTQVSVAYVPSGNTALKQETANTLTVGSVLKPLFLPRLQLSIDYYRIDLRNAIASLAGATILDICNRTNDPAYCGLLVRNSASTLTRINAPYINVGKFLTDGLDVDLAYRFPLPGGTMNMRTSGTYVFRSISQFGAISIDRVGETGTNNNTVNPVPRFRGTLSAAYEHKAASIGLLLNFIAKSKYDATYISGVTINDNTVPARLYTTLNGSILVGRDKAFEIFGAINNFFNVSPPRVPSTLFFFPTNPAFYDTIGRSFRIGVRIRR